MLSEPEKLRERAKHCRALAETTLDPAVEDTLLAMADDFDDEASRLEGEATRRNED